MLSDNSDGQIQGKQNYEVLVARYLNERAVLVDREGKVRISGEILLG